MEHATLTPVDSAEVTILVDGFVDVLMAGSDVARRPPLVPDLFERSALRAEHGYALLLTVVEGGRRRSVLYDAGLGHDTALHNLDVLEMAAGDLRAIVLSHGHADHHGGLEGIVRRLGRPGLPLVLHPDAWRQRRVVFPTGGELRLPPPSRADLEAEGVEVVEERGPSLLLDGTVLVSGQTERVTSFERGFPIQEASTGVGVWEPDPWVWDDQSVIVDVRGLGLVVLSSCSHSGAINVLRNARTVAAHTKVHAFVGGLHLSGALFEPIIPDTIAALATVAPDIVVPGHCTGWQATHELARAMPEAYIQTGVGTTLQFGAGGLP
jgi:7,8-dihydropterin-6-yl-methyl-4-(beta-D-ribofuranosyl)aminobenzene 5'-phosphate synthase